jgi:hypothetical protein
MSYYQAPQETSLLVKVITILLVVAAIYVATRCGIIINPDEPRDPDAGSHIPAHVNGRF